MVAPIYVVVDTSSSMAKAMTSLNDGLQESLKRIRRQPYAAANVRFSIIEFNSSAQTRVADQDLRMLDSFPSLSASGYTSYASAFDALSQRMCIDAKLALSKGQERREPVVLFFSDGAPTNDKGFESDDNTWKQSLDALRRQSAAKGAIFIVFGTGSVKLSALRYIAGANGSIYTSWEHEDPANIISDFLEAVTNTTIATGSLGYFDRSQLEGQNTFPSYKKHEMGG